MQPHSRLWEGVQNPRVKVFFRLRRQEVRQGFVEKDPRPRETGARLTLISRTCRLLFFDRRHLLAQGELLDLTLRFALGAADDGRRPGGA